MKVGDYVRTKEGYICKILKLNEPRYDDGYLDFNDINSSRIYKPNVVKSSPNIIDLIEVGDYVNGWKVTQITNSYVEICWGRDSDEFIKPENIKSIVTKEQFEQMEYKVGEIDVED